MGGTLTGPLPNSLLLRIQFGYFSIAAALAAPGGDRRDEELATGHFGDASGPFYWGSFKEILD